MSPEKIHLVVNHLVIIGLALAVIPLLVGLLFRSRATVISGLLIALLGGYSTGVTMGSGEEAYERYETEPDIVAALDDDVHGWLEAHEQRAHTWSKLLYGVAAGHTLCLALLIWKPKWLRPIAGVSLVLCVAGVASGVWIADTGGLIRRPDMRQGEPPVQLDHGENHALHADDSGG
jgi:hypothetical protein